MLLEFWGLHPQPPTLTTPRCPRTLTSTLTPTPRSLVRETEHDWDKEIAEDVGGECAKYGPVEHVYVDRASRGFVYVVR